ncbi:hypothetical protein [Sphingomonas sp. Leaf10]|uniref:hypothetical protein n=1 Tax=Sphingomonas sp. Leaf10 TaxID=1735676 RepID=UPI0006F66B52|nr:hypothetical protein [Sphingomonas sp. Leaf10]KQM36030.1 hypothetical protein ASE59_15270 [Sphingomonas sp. Leaf10]
MIVAVVALALAGQPARPPLLDQRRIDLLQFEVRLPEALSPVERARAIATFAADTRTIRACPDAAKIAARYKSDRIFSGTLTSRPNVPYAALPAPIRAELATVPTGHATRPYGSGRELRVLIACSALKVAPNAASQGTI